jgi:hypothetical protein
MSEIRVNNVKNETGTGAPTFPNGAVVTGIMTATDFNTTSDASLKTNINIIDSAIDKIVKINGVSFDWKETGNSSAGVIAQEVESVFPQVINVGENGIKSVNYNGLIGLLIQAVKEQNELIQELRTQITDK